MTSEFEIFDDGRTKIIVRFEYEIHPASGDGWNEPREPRHAEVTGTPELLRQHWRWSEPKGLLGARKVMTLEESLGPAPQWALDLIDDDTLTELVDD